MKINLININEFIKKLNPKDNIDGVDLLEQYYFYEKKDNIKVYNKLIKNIGVQSFINEMTSQEEKNIDYVLEPV